MAVSVTFGRVVLRMFDVFVRLFVSVFCGVAVSGCGGRGGEGGGSKQNGCDQCEFFQHVFSPFVMCCETCCDATPGAR